MCNISCCSLLLLSGNEVRCGQLSYVAAQPPVFGLTVMPCWTMEGSGLR